MNFRIVVAGGETQRLRSGFTGKSNGTAFCRDSAAPPPGWVAYLLELVQLNVAETRFTHGVVHGLNDFRGVNQW